MADLIIVSDPVRLFPGLVEIVNFCIPFVLLKSLTTENVAFFFFKFRHLLESSATSVLGQIGTDQGKQLGGQNYFTFIFWKPLTLSAYIGRHQRFYEDTEIPRLTGLTSSSWSL